MLRQKQEAMMACFFKKLPVGPRGVCGALSAPCSTQQVHEPIRDKREEQLLRRKPCVTPKLHCQACERMSLPAAKHNPGVGLMA